MNPMILLSYLALVGPLAPADVPPAKTPNASSTVSPETAARVEEILTRLEKRSNGITDIRCRVELHEDDRINLAESRKSGRIRFLITDPNPHFLIHFDRTISDGQVGKQEWYLFDGLWLYQALERTKQITKREIARQGEKVDLFDIETAPFPLPFGQKKEKILLHFDVTIAEPAEGDPPDTDHLVCIPKPGSRLERKYDKLEFFILRGLNLPRRVVATRNSGMDMITADFPDLSAKSINSGLTAKDFAHPKQWKRYDMIVEPLETPQTPNPRD